LPDPVKIGNSGSFFKNPIISTSLCRRLKEKYVNVPVYEQPNGRFKVSAGWLIEQCGWKGKRIADYGVHVNQALVLVNYGKASGKEILDLSEAIQKSVRQTFDIDLGREVNII